ncbi:glycoside hydrolase family 65 protein [Streptosporangium sandarakinum]
MDPWTLAYTGFDPRSEGVRETLCTLGNGYFATRGATPDGLVMRTPGTYAAGCYDRLTSRVAGREVVNEDLVNLPDWLPLTFAAPGAPWFHPETADLLGYEQELDMRHGVLHRRLRFRDDRGRVTSVRQRRLVSMAAPHLAALECAFTAENWSGPLRVRAALEGRVTNRGVRRYRDLRGDHLVGHATGTRDGCAWLRARTRASGTPISLAMRVTADHETDHETARETDHETAGEGEREDARITGGVQTAEDAWIAEEPTLILRRGRTAVLTKTIALTTSPALDAVDLVRRAPGFEELLREHRDAWDRLWERALMDVGESQVGQIVHLHVFHLLQTLSPHTAGLDVGVPARGLHGEAYRGHVFWDELFVLPWLDLRLPEVSRGLLLYRWRRLPAARRAARRAGHAGAMFPWQSGSDGREETPTMHLNPDSGRWLPDHSHLQRHIGLAIAHNVWHHHRATGDAAFLSGFGAELLVEIARFFASLAVLDPRSGRYEIRGVMGPDEYHDAYPGASAPGLDNNAYTNVMTVWLLLRTPEILDLVHGHERFAVTEGELDRWRDITRRMRVDFHDGVISQFTGYDRLAELDWKRYEGVRRLDRALEAEGDDPDRYRASKQADVLMLFYLLGSAQVRMILDHLGYPASRELIDRTVGYYLRRTCHGSTLSAVVHAWVLAGSQPAGAWHLFTEALLADVEDVQGGTTAEGIHLGAMAGTLDLLQRRYLGLEVHEQGIGLDPLPLDLLGGIALPILVRGTSLFVEADHHRLTVTRDGGGHRLFRVTVRGRETCLGPDERRSFPLD